jgi:N-acylneuraminate cytidylyltransferase
MKSVAIIPLRSGSKGIPGKNKKKLLGRPLYEWCLGEAILSDLDEIYVFTDDDWIIDRVKKEYRWTNKVHALKRGEENALDGSSTEDAMKEFAEMIQYDFDILCLLQATSPLTSSLDINAVLEKLKESKYDSALSVVKTKRFIWSEEGKSLNYNYLNRPRRQDFDGMLMENGAVYAIGKKQYLEKHNRLGGNIGLVQMPEESLTEIDEPSDFLILEKLLSKKLSDLKSRPQKLDLLVLDVDGVFTNGTVAVSDNGELFKTFSLRDGMGLENLRANGVKVMVMTSEDSPIVKKRMEKLGIEMLYMGVKDKYSRLSSLLSEMNISRSQLAYMGDDINDLSNLNAVAWSFCPSDAVQEVKTVCDVTLNNPGGEMAIRELTDFIISYNQRF